MVNATQNLREAFVVASNTVYNAGNYALAVDAGANNSQTLTLANNLFEQTGAHSYLAFLHSSANYYSATTYVEHDNVFYGSSGANAWVSTARVARGVRTLGGLAYV